MTDHVRIKAAVVVEGSSRESVALVGQGVSWSRNQRDGEAAVIFM